ncbi:hypothetical protein [Hyphobacterium marinum]|uniref:Uncharacterized protein n=1 Tax=Hyphobacterium marinum TaxID=3116574 RepID=A0ABU7M001_9PROT|nr:hypothetical protein [Hyphobacterium sp. Y6023]MEE2567118.1 hypothetical protein [Hyphobacterium sp. Y6023]
MRKLRWNDPPRDPDPLKVRLDDREWAIDDPKRPKSELRLLRERRDRARKRVLRLRKNKSEELSRALQKRQSVAKRLFRIRRKGIGGPELQRLEDADRKARDSLRQIRLLHVSPDHPINLAIASEKAKLSEIEAILEKANERKAGGEDDSPTC